MPTQYDTGRAHIDALLTSGKPEEALAYAVRMFPNQRRILGQAIETGNTELFREICSIPSGTEWVNGQYLPGPFRGFADTGIAEIEIPSTLVERSRNECSRNGTEITPLEVARGFAPLFVFVVCAGALVLLIVVIVVVAGSIWNGLAAGLTTAFALISEWLTYILMVVGTIVGVVYYFQSSRTPAPAPRAPQQSQHGHGDINVTVNIHSPTNYTDGRR